MKNFILTVGFICLAPSELPARELYWRTLVVNASLDREGRLHMKERQEMVFTGDWNGGERKFRMEWGQKLRFETLKRIDSDGEEHVLEEGDLSEVDQYDWQGSDTLRWRSRLPSDPPFEETTLVYELEYTLSDILVPQDGVYLLDHDFVFPDRTGRIEHFTLNLEIDPAWEPGRPIPRTLGLASLEPGEGYLLTVPLKYLAGGSPEVKYGAAAPARYALGVILVVSLAIPVILYFRREHTLGRFEPLPPIGADRQEWLDRNVFSMLPEVVGAAWDESTGAAEVAAVLARLVSEKKLSSQVQRSTRGVFGRDVLHMKLLVPRDSLTGYERKLIDALFFEGDTTDTARVRKHYEKTGFDPASKIRGDLTKKTDLLPPQGAKAPKPSRIPTLVLILAGLILLAVAGLSDSSDLIFAIVAFGIVSALYVPAVILAFVYRDRVDRLGLHFVIFFGFVLLYAAAVIVFLATGALRVSFLTLAGAVVLCVAMCHSVLNAAKSRQGIDRIRFRKRLAAARAYFRNQLESPAPQLQDSWFPYLIAFGLGRNVDRWFRAYGAAGHGYSSGYGRASGGTISAPSTGGWTGGGGAFGGGGASASWAAVAGSMAAGVSSRSSGGSSGRGSSGGGGGGGW